MYIWSPKKVLHSVKECILRIALVHLGTSFKMVDIERCSFSSLATYILGLLLLRSWIINMPSSCSGVDVISLYPSSSPLPLLASGFGVEVSHSLHKLDESDGKLKLSGYISGPYGTFSVKVFILLSSIFVIVHFLFRDSYLAGLPIFLYPCYCIESM